MEDPTVFQGINPHFPEHEQLKCPRCDSTNTKFCYYNNYNLSQPRYYCKNCRRYWTKGGTLRNIPVGGGSRKNNKRPNPKKASAFSSTSSSSSSTTAASLQSVPKSESAGVHGGPAVDHDHRMLDVSGSFSSLLYSNEQLGNLMESVNSGASLAPQGLHFSECVENGNSIAGAAGDSNMELAESRCWNGPNGWPDLAIYTPDSKFQ